MAPFIATSMESLTDERVPAEDLFVGIDQLIDEVVEASNDRQRVGACVRYLTRSIDLDRSNSLVQRAAQCITQANGQISVEALATLTGTSRRSLQLAFKNEVGTSPKMYCRIARFRHLYDVVSNHGLSEYWAQAALDSGFFDQSHLIRDFRRFAGEPPDSFLAKSRNSLIR